MVRMSTTFSTPCSCRRSRKGSNSLVECPTVKMTDIGFASFLSLCNLGPFERMCSLQPDVVVLDIRLGDGWDGLELPQDTKNSFFALPVILCAAYDTFKYDPRSVAADFYVVKSSNLAELKDKIRRTVMKAAPTPTSPSVSRQIETHA